MLVIYILVYNKSLALKIFDHESCVKRAQFELIKCLIICNLNRVIVLERISFEKCIGLIDVEKGTIAMNNGTTV